MTTFAVCPRCEGRGSHTNPAIDGHGITEDEMYELGEDFREDYFSGVYDIACEECRGNRVVPACHCGVPVLPGHTYNDDLERVPYATCYDHLSDEERKDYHDLLDMYAEQAAEIRAGC